MILLSNNFSFLKEDSLKDVRDINSILATIAAAEQYYDQSNYDLIPIKIRKMMEDISKNCLVYGNKFDEERDSSLNDCIKKINETWLTKKDWKIRNSFYMIKNTCNFYCHSNQNKSPMATEIVQMFFAVHTVISYYLKMFANKEIDVPEFNEKIYFTSLNKEVKNIITEETKKDLQQQIIKMDAMDANIVPIVNILLKQFLRFKVPIYQRGYRWNNDNIEALIYDIFSRKDDRTYHFFGNVACKKDTKNNVYILDGQQRLTTSLLVLVACSNVLDQYTKNNWIVNDYLTLQNGENLFTLFKNPGGTEENNRSFRNILNNRKSSTTRIKTRYDENFDLIELKIKENIRSIEEIEDFTKTFCDKFLVNFLELKENQFPYKKEMEVFENLNTKGTALSADEIIKNYLIGLCSEETLKDERSVINVYNHAFEDCSLYTKKDRDEKGLLSEFFQSFSNYFTGEEIKINSYNKETSVFNTFKNAFQIWATQKKIVNEFKDLSFSEFSEIINELKKYFILWLSVRYSNKSRPLQSSMLTSDLYRDLFNELLPKTKYKPLYPFVFLLADKTKVFYGANSSQIAKSIRCYFLELIKVLIKHFISKGQGDSQINRFFYSICNTYRIKDGEYEVNELTNLISIDLNGKVEYNEFKKKLPKCGNNWAVKSLLLLTESSFRGENDRCSTTKFTKPTVEHVMPQNITKWRADICRWNNISYDECDQKSREYVDWFGNYTLLTIEKNSEIKDEPFDVKISKLSKEQSLLFRNSDDSIDISRKHEWSFKNIENRTESLTKYICKNIILK